MIVMARSTPPGRSTNTPITAEGLAALKEAQVSRSKALIRERKEIPHLLALLETRARELRFECEHAVKPAIAAPFGITNLALHPVTLRLSSEDNAGDAPFHRFTDWLHGVSLLPNRSEITQIEILTEARGLGSATVTLHFYSANNHAEVSPK